jgi:hypothetical protein
MRAIAGWGLVLWGAMSAISIAAQARRLGFTPQAQIAMELVALSMIGAGFFLLRGRGRSQRSGTSPKRPPLSVPQAGGPKVRLCKLAHQNAEPGAAPDPAT